MNYERINSVALNNIKDKLLHQVLSGNHVLHGNPFLPNMETMFEEFGIWKEDFFQRIHTLLALPESDGLLVVKIAESDNEISFLEGHRLPKPLDFHAYNQAGFELDFIGNGAETLFFDRTFKWCVGTVVDVHFIGATAEIMNIFYPDQNLKLEKQKDFAAWAKDTNLQHGYQLMPDYVS